MFKVRVFKGKVILELGCSRVGCFRVRVFKVRVFKGEGV